MNELQRVAASGPHGSRPVPAVLAIAEASVSIAEALATAPIRGALGAAGEINVQGEVQQKMDVIADKFVEHALRQHQAIAAMGSEEREHLVSLHWDGDLVVLVDPLDGSSNLDVNGAVGTIFLVLARPDEGKLSDQDALQPGQAALAAGYVMYGPALAMALTVGDGTHILHYDPAESRWRHTHKHIRIPEDGGYYSVNEANRDRWTDDSAAGIERLKAELGLGLRYVGSMVADVHRTLLKGGVFLYPPDKKNPNGKLRLMYEAIPMAWLVEQAGGEARTADARRILDVQPEAIHQRVPVYLGARRAVELLLGGLA